MQGSFPQFPSAGLFRSSRERCSVVAFDVSCSTSPLEVIRKTQRRDSFRRSVRTRLETGLLALLGTRSYERGSWHRYERSVRTLLGAPSKHPRRVDLHDLLRPFGRAWDLKVCPASSTKAWPRPGVSRPDQADHQTVKRINPCDSLTPLIVTKLIKG